MEQIDIIGFMEIVIEDEESIGIEKNPNKINKNSIGNDWHFISEQEK